MERIVLGGGCFWCFHATFSLVRGVQLVEQGYSGGDIEHPNDEQIYYQNTGHAEVVKITYDANVISLPEILEIFWTLHNPTTLNRQGPDIGTQYRSIVFYENDLQKTIIESALQKAQQFWDEPIVTEIAQLKTFYSADPRHDNYETDRPDYCQVVINPKLSKLRKNFADKLKT